MNHRQLISDAWVFTQENKRLIVWYAFPPTLLVTVVGVLYFIYQFYSFKSSVFFENWNESFTFVVLRELYAVARQHVDSIVPIIIFLLILALFYFFIPPVSEGAIVQLIARRKNGQNVRLRDGARYGLLSFLPLFNYSWVARTFNLFAILGEASFVARNLGPNAVEFFWPIFVLILIISIILSVLFIFTEYFIIIDDCHVKEAMAKSAALVMKHWDMALMLSFLLLLIAFRILLQIIFVLVVPIIILAIIYVIASSSIPLIGLIIGIFISFISLLFASYLGAIIHVFTSTVWVFTFLHLTNNPDPGAREKIEPAES